MSSAKTILLLAFLIMGASNDPSEKKGIDRRMDTFINGLMKKMTLEEKIGQLSLFTSDWSVTGPSMRKDYLELIEKGKAGAVFNAFTVDYVTSLQKIAVEKSRLKIPLIFGYDVIHGYRTIFPVPIAQASSWDLAAIERSDHIAASEATAEGVTWTFGPMVDIARDPRWGRVVEGAGEDTWLGSKIATARVRGFQGTNPGDKRTMLACVKHFAAYGASEAGRDYNTVDMSERSLCEWYLPPYRAAINAGAGSVMTSFSEIAGVPATSDKWLLQNILRDQWSFKGFVVSDYSSVNELIKHGVAADTKDAAMLAINAGLDMDMQAGAYLSHLKTLVETGKVSIKTVNDAVKRVLIAKYKLGLFEDPFRYCDKTRETTEVMTPENLAFAREFAAASVVLLKNEKNTLPVPEKVSTIAVIGPLADSRIDMLGSWSAAGDFEKCVTLYEGIKNRAKNNIKVILSKGCDVNSNNSDGFGKAIAAARQADFVILALGESASMSGEAASRTDISLPGNQMDLAKKILATGVPAVVVLFNGRPLVIEELDTIAPAILEAWFGGTQAGNGIADVLFGDVNPSGKLTMTFPRNVGQIPIFYNSKNTGRPFDPLQPGDKYKSRYIDSPNTPLYPFGYGLSYTTFRYSGLAMEKTLIGAADTIKVRVDITNTGERDGTEIVQLYIHDMVGDVTRPLKELRGFQKVSIRKGETKRLMFRLTLAELSYYHQDMQFTYDPGDFELYIGPSSSEGLMTVFSVL